MEVFTELYWRTNVSIQEALTSGTFFIAKADALNNTENANTAYHPPTHSCQVQLLVVHTHLIKKSLVEMASSSARFSLRSARTVHLISSIDKM
jgi:hypothetical protein